MSYQDEWVNGAVQRRGYRECAERYEIIKKACAALNRRAFSVCDIGSNLCYFGLRLTEDYPGAIVSAFESHRAAYSRAKTLIAANCATRIDLANKRLGLVDIDAMARVQGFDVVLALSVLHHVTGEFGAWLSALERLGSVVIVEAAGLDSHRVAAKATKIPSRAVRIGQAPSHLNPEVPRTIFMLKGQQGEV